MKHCRPILLSLTITVLMTNPVLAQNTAAAGFAKLKSLVGEWHAKTADGQSATLSYQLVSGGSALMETLAPANEPSMTSLYHLDGDTLIMTHYCSAGNQPRMRAVVPAGEIKSLNFTFVDGTNIAKSSDGHIHGLTMTFQDKDHLTQTWRWRQDGKDEAVTYYFTRGSSPPASSKKGT